MPIPIVVVGATEQVGKSVVAGMSPEYEGMPPIQAAYKTKY